MTRLTTAGLAVIADNDSLLPDRDKRDTSYGYITCSDTSTP
ncbi:hypothetical protein GCM10009525_39670 [Streptosporangium amethystogenes subsp. fukuiense]